MQIPKPSDSAQAAFIAVVAPMEGAVVKPMFGNIGAFVNGHMFAGLFGSDLGVKLADADTVAELVRTPGTGPFGPAGRPMGGYLSLPSDWAARPDFAAEWVGIAFEQISALPPKAPKPRKG